MRGGGRGAVQPGPALLRACVRASSCCCHGCAFGVLAGTGRRGAPSRAGISSAGISSRRRRRPAHPALPPTPPPARPPAVEEGIVPGGGAALLHLSELVPAFKEGLTDPEEAIGADIVMKALRAPCRAIAGAPPPPPPPPHLLASRRLLARALADRPCARSRRGPPLLCRPQRTRAWRAR